MLSFLRDNARWLGAGFLLTFCSSFGQTFFIGQVNEELRGAFALSHGGLALLYGLATAASAATLPFLGQTLDTQAGARVAGWAIPALALACLGMALVIHPVMLLIVFFGLRLFGQGMMSHIALTETGRWFAANRGRATSLVVPGFQAGEATLPILFTALAAGLGWRWAWALAAAALILVVRPVAVRLLSVEREPRGEATARVTAARDWTRAEVLRDPLFWALLTGVLAPPFIGTTVFYHQDYLSELRGYPPFAFPAAFTMMAATTVTCALICGGLVDRFGATRLLPFFLLPLSVAAFAVGTLDAVWGVFAFMVLFGISYGFTSTLLGALWPEVYGTRFLGSVRAVIVSGMVASTALGPVVTGLLIDRGVPLPVQMVWLAAWALSAAGVLALVSPRLVARAAPVTA